MTSGSFNYGTEIGYHSQSEEESEDDPAFRLQIAKEKEKAIRKRTETLQKIAENQEVVKAWLGVRMEINPSRLEFVSIDLSKGGLVYRHPGRGEVILNEGGIKCREVPLYDFLYYGFERPSFIEFSKGFTQTGKKPGFLHPFLRKCYNEGVEARTRKNWPERQIPKDEEETDSEDDGRTPPSYYQIRRGF
jgi:hypothetical protein